MTNKEPSSAARLQAVADYQPISDDQYVAKLMAEATRVRKLFAATALMGALMMLSALMMQLYELLSHDARVLALIFGGVLLAAAGIAYWMAGLPNAQTVQNQLQYWAPEMWHLTPEQEHDLLLLAQQHEALRPHITQWVESGHPLRLEQSQRVRAWLDAVEGESRAAATAVELQGLRQQFLQSAHSKGSGT